MSAFGSVIFYLVIPIGVLPSVIYFAMLTMSDTMPFQLIPLLVLVTYFAAGGPIYYYLCNRLLWWGYMRP